MPVDQDVFSKFMKKKGKKPQKVEYIIHETLKFANFLQKVKNKDIDNAKPEDLDSYISSMKNSKMQCYALLNYYGFTGNDKMRSYSVLVRRNQINKTQTIFSIKDFLHVNPKYIKKLAELGIINVKQMLKAGKTKAQRQELAKKISISEEDILELVELSDITRIGYVKKKLARLYYNAGFHSPLDLVAYEGKEEDLQAHFRKYIKESGWEGMVPNLSDLKNNIKSAKKLKPHVEK